MIALARSLAAAAGLGAALGAAPAAAESPEILYMLHCQGCHLADGSGAPGAVPTLVDWMGRFASVPEGRAYLIRVPGSAQSSLSDAELADVLTWMVARFGPAELAGSAVPFTAAEVARHRDPPLVDVDPVRRRLLARIRAGAPEP